MQNEVSLLPDKSHTFQYGLQTGTEFNPRHDLKWRKLRVLRSGEYWRCRRNTSGIMQDLFPLGVIWWMKKRRVQWVIPMTGIRTWVTCIASKLFAGRQGQRPIVTAWLARRHAHRVTHKAWDAQCHQQATVIGRLVTALAIDGQRVVANFIKSTTRDKIPEKSTFIFWRYLDFLQGSIGSAVLIQH